MYKNIFLVLITTILVSSCENHISNSHINTITNGDTVWFKIHIDTMICADTICVYDSITIKLSGYIGPNLCYSFSHFERYGPTPGNIHRMSVWGKYVPAPICLLAVSYLREKAYRIKPQQQGIFYINIVQPDYSILKDSIVIQ